RVGNEHFSERVRSTTGQIYRVVNGVDLVNTVPPKSNLYQHVTTRQQHIVNPGKIVEDESASTGRKEALGVLRTAVAAIGTGTPPDPLRDHSPLFYLYGIKSAL